MKAYRTYDVDKAYSLQLERGNYTYVPVTSGTCVDTIHSPLEDVKHDARLDEYYAWNSVRLDDPFVYYMVEQLEFSETDSRRPQEKG